MKKFYLLLLMCWFAISANAQVSVTLFPAAPDAVGSFVTGNSTATVRTDNTIVSTAATQRGYAVFDLTGIPAGATIGSCTINWYQTVTGSGTGVGWQLNGYAGDLSTIFTPATLFAAMSPATPLSSLTWGITTGNMSIASTAAITAFLQANIGTRVSVCWTGGGTRIYTINGEGGVLSTTAVNHQPFLNISYCVRPTGVTATATPNPLCTGATLTLNGSATGATNFNWTGPSAYSSTAMPSTLVVSAASAGVYTLAAINSCGTFSATATATTAAVVVNPLPAVPSGSTAVCSGGGTTTLTDASGTGTWTSSNTANATIDNITGLVTGILAGTTTIQFTLNSTGCVITSVETINDAPAAISGPTNVCVGNTITLTDASSGGNWTSTAGTGTASVGGGSGIVTGSTGGTATINYTIPGCPAATYPIVVDPLPALIGGATNVCQGFTTTLTNGTSGGTWSSSNATIASVGSLTGIVTGNAVGGVTIYYTLPTGCQISTPFTVNANPAPIGGPSSVCPFAGTFITLSDATPGGTWSSSNLSKATVVAGTGVVTGIATGVVDISYIITATGCYETTPITIYPLPAKPTGVTNTVCQNSTITLTDTDPGGEWSSSNAGIAAVGTTTGIVSGTGAGNAYIYYTLPTGCYDTVQVHVNAAPASVITPGGPTTFCTGGSVLLVASGGGTAYQWYNNGVPIFTGTGSTYTATTSDTFTVRVTNALGCSAVSNPVKVTASINAIINSSSATSFCIGGNTILTANTGGVVGSISYQWMKNGLVIPSATLVNYFVNASGNYQVIVTISGGSGSCVDTASGLAVNVNPLPNPVASFNGVTVNTTNTYATYQWFVNTIGISGATNYSWLPSVNGGYKVKVTDINGCSNYSNTVQVSVVGINQIQKSGVKVYPNPANSVLHIESADEIHAIITGIEGRIMIDEYNAKNIDISHLANGLYLITLYNSNGDRISLQKLVKE